MKAPKEYYVKTGNTIEAVEAAKAIAAFAKEHEIKKADAEEAILYFAKGGKQDDLDFSVIEDAAIKKAQVSLYKAAEKFVDASKENKQKLNDQIAEEEEAEKKKAEKLKLSAEKGATSADKFGLTIASDFQKMLGPKFVANEYGLSLADGQSVSEDDLSAVISTLAEGSEKVNELRSQTLIKLGDGVRIARREFGQERGDQIVQQAVEVRGQGKHNVMQAESVMEYIDELYASQEDRPVGLYFTHLQEAKNYGWNKKHEHVIPKATVKKILKKAQEENLSCADLRALLKAARPQETPAPGAADGEGGGDEGGEVVEEQGAARDLFGYLYMEVADINVIHFREELDKEMLKETVDDGSLRYHVLSLADKAVLKSNAKVDVYFRIEEPEEDMAE